MRAFSIQGVSVKSFFGYNAKTIANPTGPPSGGSPTPTPKTWSVLTTGFETSQDVFFQIFWLGNHWIITTSQGTPNRVTVLTSVDGIHWIQRVVFVSAFATEFPGAAFGAGVWIVTGAQNGVVPSLHTSPDLITWTSRNMGFPASTFFQNPVFGNGVFLIVGGNGGAHYATSPDGINWTQQNSYVPNFWGQPVFDGARFVAPVLNPSNVPKMVTSTDGINWTEQPVSIPLANPSALGNRGGNQYVVGDSSTVNAFSLNSALTAATASQINNLQNSWIAYGAGSDWAQSNALDAAVRSSPDGINWATDNVPGTAGVINNMAWNGSEWIAVGGSNASSNFAMNRGP